MDSDWDDLCERFDLNINPGTLRKAGVGVKLVSDAGLLATDAELFDVHYMERQKTRDLNAQIHEAFRAEARSELLREILHDSIASLPSIMPPEGRPERKKRGEREMVLCLGDFHYGADIHVEGLYGETLNEYNDKVFERRMWSLLAEVEEIVRKENVDVLHVFLVGDLIDGMLRQSQLMRLQYGIVESTVRLSETLAQWISNLTLFADIHVYACTGNHSEIRPLKAKSREYEDENLEKIIMWFLDERFTENECVTIHSDCKRMVMADVCGFNFLLLHGDGVKKIKQIAQDAVNLYQKPVDFFICGHLHREEDIPSGMTSDGHSVIIRTPSICGIDRYAQSLGYGGGAGATMILMEKGYGRRCVYPIKLK